MWSPQSSWHMCVCVCMRERNRKKSLCWIKGAEEFNRIVGVKIKKHSWKICRKIELRKKCEKSRERDKYTCIICLGSVAGRKRRWRRSCNQMQSLQQQHRLKVCWGQPKQEKRNVWRKKRKRIPNNIGARASGAERRRWRNGAGRGLKGSKANYSPLLGKRSTGEYNLGLIAGNMRKMPI